LSSLLSVLPRISSTPALSAAACMPAWTVCMNVSDWNTTPAMVSFLAGCAGAAVGSAFCSAGAAGAGAGCAAGATHAVTTMERMAIRAKSCRILLADMGLSSLKKHARECRQQRGSPRGGARGRGHLSIDRPVCQYLFFAFEHNRKYFLLTFDHFRTTMLLCGRLAPSR